MTKISTDSNILFILSVDTEEEWDWSGPFPEKNFSLENTRNIPEFQEFCNTLGIRPTYFVDYAVADDLKSSMILRNIAEQNQCEIGGHLHPWCNPPFTGKATEERSHVVNLPISLVEEKIDLLNQKIKENIGITPRSFRTGRWGINGPVLSLLEQKGYNLDSSVYPYYSNEFFSCHNFPSEPYWPDLNDPTLKSNQRRIFEIPVTAGFNRSNFSLMSKIHNTASSSPWNLFKPIGILWQLGLLRKIYLSPELSQIDDMLALVDKVLLSGRKVIHMYLHSSSLRPGCNNFVRNNQDKERLYSAIKEVVNFIQLESKVEFCTISEAGYKLNNSPALA